MGLRQDGPNAALKIGYRTYNERTWTASCDWCNKKADKGGVLAGDASDAARKEGFVFVPTGLTTPMKLCCPVCHEKRLESGKASYKAIPQSNGLKNGKSIAMKNPMER